MPVPARVEGAQVGHRVQSGGVARGAVPPEVRRGELVVCCLGNKHGYVTLHRTGNPLRRWTARRSAPPLLPPPGSWPSRSESGHSPSASGRSHSTMKSLHHLHLLLRDGVLQLLNLTQKGLLQLLFVLLFSPGEHSHLQVLVVDNQQLQRVV